MRAPRVFVSYRREDTAGYAGRLYDALSARFGDENVFMDVDTIDLGTDFHQAIDRAIASCDAAIVLIGRNWLTATGPEGRRRLDDPDDVLRLELERVLERGLVVVPTCVQGAALPAERDLPAPLAPLVRRQGIDLRDSAWRDDLDRLLRRLERVARDGEAGRGARLRRPSRRMVAVAAAVAVAALAAVVLALALGGDPDDTSRGNDAATSPTERRLLAAIPPAVRSSCEGIDYGPDVARASVSCQGGGALAIEYYLFETPTVMADWYEIQREDAGIEPGTGACTPARFRGERSYVVDGRAVGRYACFVDGKEPWLFWSDARVGVGARANVWKGTGRRAIQSLLRQWGCCLQLEKRQTA